MRLALLLLIASLASAQESYRVRLFSVQQPQKLFISNIGEGAEWKQCASCAWKPLTGTASLSAEASQVRTADGTTPIISVRGRVKLTVSSQKPLESDYPLDISSRQSRLSIIASMPTERYVEAVLAGETSATDPPEYLKAMAVAARSYAKHFPGLHKLEGFDFCDTTHCQNAQLAPGDPRFHNAVEATKNELLWYQGAPAATYYHRHCGGKTEAARDVWSDKASPYLSSHDDPYCLIAGRDEWQATITKQNLVRALAQSSIKPPAPELLTLLVLKRSPGNRVQLLDLSGQQLSASSLRFAVGRALGWNLLKSDWYDLQDRGADILFTGRGHGHGVGLCQIGAVQMAKQGKTYRAILAFYYPGTKLGLNAQGIEWQSLKKDSIELLSAQPQNDSRTLDVAHKLLAELESQTQLRGPASVQLKVFATVEQFRDATGEPGWVAASTRGRMIRLQPLGTLETKRILESTFRHELAHVLLEANTTVKLPLWFREGLVLNIANESVANAPPLSTQEIETVLQEHRDQQKMAAAYAQSKKLVGQMIQQYGLAKVFTFLRTGLPAQSR